MTVRERRFHCLPQCREFVGSADQLFGRWLPGLPHGGGCQRLAQYPLVRGLEAVARIDAEILGKASTYRAKGRQRLDVTPCCAERCDETGVHRLVQRSDHRGQSQRRQHPFRLTERDREFCRGRARVEELVVQGGEYRHGRRFLSQSGTRWAAPEVKCFDVVVESRLVAAFFAGGPGGGDELAEVDQVEHARAGREQVSVASAQQVRAGAPGCQRGLHQSPQRADVLVDDVERTGRGPRAPDQVDELGRADRMSHPGEQ